MVVLPEVSQLSSSSLTLPIARDQPQRSPFPPPFRHLSSGTSFIPGSSGQGSTSPSSSPSSFLSSWQNLPIPLSQGLHGRSPLAAPCHSGPATCRPRQKPRQQRHQSRISMFLSQVLASSFRSLTSASSPLPAVTSSPLAVSSLTMTSASALTSSTACSAPAAAAGASSSLTQTGTAVTAAAPTPAATAAAAATADEEQRRADLDGSFGVGHEILGVDIGGTSIKAAPVDTRHGTLIVPKHVILTPDPATPESCADVIRQMVEHFQWRGAVGVGVPAVVKQGTTWTAANIDKSWIGAPAEQIFRDALGGATAVTIVNDADAAGYAEMGFGSGSGDNERGVVFVATFGTGIGTAMFVDGILVPNLELGHIELDGLEAEAAAAGVLVERQKWTWQQWAEKVSWYLGYLERLFWPTLFIVGGGVSNAHEKWLHLVKLPQGTPVVAATMKNDAGIVGAAMAALARAAYDATHKPLQVDEYIAM